MAKADTITVRIEAPSEEDVRRVFRETTARIEAETTRALAALAACRAYIVRLPSTHKTWRICVCEHCPKIRALMGDENEWPKT